MRWFKRRSERRKRALQQYLAGFTPAPGRIIVSGPGGEHSVPWNGTSADVSEAYRLAYPAVLRPGDPSDL